MICFQFASLLLTYTMLIYYNVLCGVIRIIYDHYLQIVYGKAIQLFSISQVNFGVI